MPGSLVIERREGGSGAPTLAELVGSIRAAGASKGRLLTELEATVASCRLIDSEVRILDRRAMAFDRLDCAVDEGHPYHPSFKARLGFTPDDQRLYAPEFANIFQLLWVAVPRSAVGTALPQAEDRFLADLLGAADHARLRGAMPRAISRRCLSIPGSGGAYGRSSKRKAFAFSVPSAMAIGPASRCARWSMSIGRERRTSSCRST
jgi:hypothetical protein